jgi:hypothetical protein
MFEKAGKFYADWRDKAGKRKRKSFNSAKAALVHEADMRSIAHPKQKTLGRPSPRYLASKSSGGKQNEGHTKKQPHSSLSQRLAVSPRINSPKRTSSKSCTQSRATVTPIRQR